jgi:hypothetical protein
MGGHATEEMMLFRESGRGGAGLAMRAYWL